MIRQRYRDIPVSGCSWETRAGGVVSPPETVTGVFCRNVFVEKKR